jgi:hypothetical protein
MPGVELGSALADRVRGPLGVKQIIVLVDAAAFAQHREARSSRAKSMPSMPAWVTNA